MNQEEFISEFLAEPQPWVQRAACRGMHPARFQMEQGQSARRIKEQACDTPCPVRDECLAYGIRTGSVGVWGGVVLTLARNGHTIVPLVPVHDGRPQPVAAPVRRTAAARQATGRSDPGRIAAQKLR